jgi:GH24 family phage-related lysozyme (muramidase)
MRISDQGRALIRKHEGLRLDAYLCPAGVWTIGYGHTSAAGEPTVVPGMRITRAEADAILSRDLRAFEAGVSRLVKAQLTQGQFDAMVSFAFNVGLGALAKSTLLRRINAGRMVDVPAELMRWTKAGGRTLPGLVNRRRDEAALWRSIDPTATGGRGDAGQPERDAGKPLTRSRTMAGGGLAGAGAAVVVAQEAQQALTQANDQISAGTWLGIAVGVLILIGAGLALYARWDDAGRPLPWAR